MHDALQVVPSALRIAVVSDFKVVLAQFAFVNDDVVVPIRSLVLVIETNRMHDLVQADKFCSFGLKSGLRRQPNMNANCYFERSDGQTGFYVFTHCSVRGLFATFAKIQTTHKMHAPGNTCVTVTIKYSFYQLSVAYVTLD